MSLFVAHVQLADGKTVDVDCDAAHVNDTGHLSLTINTYVGAIACWQPSAWISYRLEAPPAGDADSCPAEGPKPPKVGDRLHLWGSGLGCLAGTVERPTWFGSGLLIKIDRVEISQHALVADLLDESRTVNGSWHWPCDGKDPALPEVGDVVHIWDFARARCLPGPVISINHTALEVEAGDDPRFTRYIAIHHDETRSIDQSWHRPCGSDGQDATATPGDPERPITVTVHIDGPKIYDVINKQMLAEYRAYPGPLRH